MYDMGQILSALHEKPIAFYPVYARIAGDVKSGVLLSQIMFWHRAMKLQEFYKSDAEFMAETMLSEREFRTAKSKIKKLSFVKVTRKGNPATTYYDIDYNKLMHALNSVNQSVQTSLDETSNQDWMKRQNKNSQNVQSIITENTTENTQRKDIYTPPVKKETFGEFGNVRLTYAEYQKLGAKLGDHVRGQYIERLSAYLAQKKKKYSSHYATILNWYRKDHPDNDVKYPVPSMDSFLIDR